MPQIAIITARGGSKRIPAKNIRNFCGKPIIAYSIEAARGAGIFDEIMVSTDSEEIKHIALKFGASVPFLRSEANSGDYSTTADVLNEVLNQYEKQGKHYTYICCIYPTAPFVTPERLRESMDSLINSGADSLFPVVPFSFPPQRALYLENGLAHPKYPDVYEKRSQDLQQQYHDAGQYYCLSVSGFKKSKRIVTDNTRVVVLNELEVQDIDNESDWSIAELKYRILHPESGVKGHL